MLTTLAAFLALAACGKKSFTAPPDGGAVLGMARLAYVDEERRSWAGDAYRPLATTLWYPAAADAKIEEIVIPAGNPAFIGGWAARDAAPLDAKRPLIVLSHGTGGAAFQMMWLARRLVAAGYIVAAVDHHGNSAAEAKYDARGFMLPAERAADVTAVIDRLLEDPAYGPLIDGARIGVAGFSLGGHTVVTLAGGVSSFAQFEAFCAGAPADAACKPQAEFPEARATFDAMLADDAVLRRRLTEQGASYADPRIKSFVAIAPALAQAFTDDSLRKITAPIAIISAGADTVAPVATNAERLAGKIFDAKATTIDGAAHYSFLNECTPRGRRFLPICKDAGAARADLHDRAATLAIEHFRMALGPIQ
ncbi:MAG: alpha/beta hydrolase family protein [Parvularculaceae bacterium]